jgi:hypothetical protein
LQTGTLIYGQLVDIVFMAMERKSNISDTVPKAVMLAQRSKNTSETARNLGVASSVLRRWKKELA